MKGEIYLHHITAVEKADSEHLGNRKYALQVLCCCNEHYARFIL